MSKMITGIIGIFLIVCSSLYAQDPTEVDSNHYTVEYENDDVRVLRITYGPNEKSVMHQHPAGLAVFLTDGKATFHYEDGTSEEVTWKKGDVIWSPAVKHRPENLMDQHFELIQVEMKKPQNK